MSFTEAQIQRYSRHILLKEVGGIGQRKLLDACVKIIGTGEAIGVAVAYLAAAGTQIVHHESFSGFLFETNISRLNADAVGTQIPRIILSTGTLVAPTELIHVQINSSSVSWSVPNCTDLKETKAESLSSAVLLGSVASLVIQRLILGLETESGTMHFKSLF